MAVTNRARGAEKSPAWAARGKLRLAFVKGGPSHAAVLVHAGAWNNAPAVLHAACTRYGPALVDELVSKKINAVVLTWGAGLSPQSDAAQRVEIARLIPLLKKKKIRAIAAIYYDIVWKVDIETHAPRLMEYALPKQRGDSPTCAMDLSAEGWRKLVIESAIGAVEAGVEGLYLNGGHDAGREGEFIKAIRAAAQERAGEAPLVIFSPGWLIPKSIIGNLKLRDAAFLSNGGREREAPPTVGRPRSFPVAEAGGTQPGSMLNIGELKLLFEVSGRDKTAVSAFIPFVLSAQQAALATAEVLACGAACGHDAPHVASLAFAEEHPDFFSGDPVNSIGVLVNDHDENAGADGIVGVAKLLSALAGANIQFDVIPASELANFELRKYRVLSALHLQRLAPETAVALKVFASEHGRTLIAGSQTARGERPSWLSAFTGSGSSREEAPLGKGRVIHHAHAPGDLGEHDRAASESLITAISTDLFKYGENPLECSASKGVVCLLWGKGTRRWVHVLNYTNAPVKATILLPGCGGRKLHVFSPDAAAPELTVVESGAARAAFVLKNLTTYAVVEVV